MYCQIKEAVAEPEGGRGGAARSKIDQNLAKLAPFVPILASTPPLTDHPQDPPLGSVIIESDQALHN